MAKLTNCLSIVLVLLASSAGAQEWKLIWSDEFNTPGMFGYVEGILANTNELFLNANVNPYKSFADVLEAESNLSLLTSTPLDDDAGRAVFT
ncbi:MAG: hypothetical protein JJ992_23965, partial [Planctomycetes bacterium]|nr:hypothetical protein [Planctomycetota bacterium]